MKVLLAVPIGFLALGGYMLAGTSFANGFQRAGMQAQIIGNGQVTSVNRRIGTFRQIEIGGGLIGEFREGTPGVVKLSGESNLLENIELKLIGDTLQINSKKSYSSSQPITITASTKLISALKASGASQVKLLAIGRHPLQIDASGAAKVHVEGSPNRLALELSGASQVKGGRFTLEGVVATLSGASKLRLDGTANYAKFDASGASKFDGSLTGKEVTAVASGASNLSFGGHYVVTKFTTSGAAKISSK